MAQKKGWMTRLLEGKEKSEEYARSTLPTNRWQLFWDIFKGNFGKIVKVNLLTVLFFIPLIAIIVIYLSMAESDSMFYGFSANLGAGYPSAPFLSGIAEFRTMINGTFLYVGVFVSSFVAAIGLAGGMYVVRNMVWTEGIFVTNDFWRGIKLNYKNAMQAAVFFSVIFLFTGTLINSAEFYITAGLSQAETVWMRISQGTSYVLLVLAILMSLWMLALGVNYEMKFFTLIKNSFLLTVSTIFHSVFFAVLAAIPFALCFIPQGLIIFIAVTVILLFGVAYTLLVWLNFAQWVFDKYLNPKIAGAKVGRGIYNKDATSSVQEALQMGASESSKEYQRTILAYGKSKLMARPIKPIDDSLQVYELPASFSREDLKRLRESKQHIEEDTANYAEEHKNDLRYVEYNKQFEEREKALQDSDEKKKKRKPKLLKD